MFFTIHIATSLFLAAVLYPFIGLYYSLLVFLGGWAVDIDHYIWYIFKYKNFNMLECNKFFTVDSRTNNSRHFRGSFMPFHTIEFMIIMAVLSLKFQVMLYLSIGLAFHFLLDFLSYRYIEKDFPLYHSIIYWATRRKSKGLNK